MYVNVGLGAGAPRAGVVVLRPPVFRRRGVSGQSAACAIDPNSPDCVFVPTSQADCTGRTLFVPASFGGGGSCLDPALANPARAAQIIQGAQFGPFASPGPPGSPTFISTVPSGLQAAVQVPDLASYLASASYSATNLGPAAGGGQQAAIDSINQAAARYRAIYPAAPYSQAVVDAAISKVRGFYSGASSGGGATFTSHDPGVAASATLSNTSRPGQDFEVGDSFRLVLTGAPGAPVADTATQNGKSLGTTTYGVTDSNGQKVIDGQMASPHVGAWREMWTVGAQSAPVISFTVSVPSGGGGGGQSGGGGGPAAAQTGTASQPSWTDFLTSTFPFGVPLWAVGAGAIGVGMLFFSGGGGGRKR